MTESSNAFHALRQLAQQSLNSAAGLPAQIEISPHWNGIGFELLGQRFVAPMGEVSEMLEVPPFTHLPGVQSWAKGVANVRGRLLPLFDLAGFFGDQLTAHRKQHRVLVLESDGLYSGLIVDRVFGMQHFPVDSYQDQHQAVLEALEPYLQGSYQSEGVAWTVFSPAALGRDARFLDVALLQ